jgi:hypothetical protein
MTTSKERFWKLAKRELKTDSVTVEGETFSVREMSEADAADLEVKLQDKEGKIDYTRHRRLVVALCLVDEDGNRIVDNPDDLKDCPKKVIGAIYERALELSNYDKTEVKSLAKKSDEASD